ncbi:hypothetical protein MMC13_005125 [Lambiella insularis]|nr:hypothetical protein [Lambiella insularis]
MEQLDLLRRQYLQVLDPEDLCLPQQSLIKLPLIQKELYETMFSDNAFTYPPPNRYKLRVLKKLVEAMEKAVMDPEEDEISDDLTICLAQLMTENQVPESVAAQKMSYVTYTAPLVSLNPPTVTTLEARSLLAAGGTTGLRTWEAALHLGTYLSSAEGRTFVQGKRIIELGAGTGFLSMLCSKHLGAEHVLSTDGSGEVVDGIVSNVFLNGLGRNLKIDSRVLKWGYTPVDGILDRRNGARNFELVLGADITFDERLILPLVSTLSELFENKTLLKGLISATVRNQHTLDLFETACQAKNFTIQDISFLCPPQEDQIGFFHSTKTPIRLYMLTGTRVN